MFKADRQTLGTTEADTLSYHRVIECMQREMGKWHAFWAGQRKRDKKSRAPKHANACTHTLSNRYTHSLYTHTHTHLMDRAAGPFSPTLHTQDSPSAPNMSVMCVFMRHVRRNKVSPWGKHESSAHQENVLHVWWKCTWFQFISSEDINVFIHKPGEGLDDERDPSEPQTCFSFRFPRCSLIYWHIYAAQFISVLGRLQFVQITLHFGFNLLRAADGWICDDRRSSNANSSQRSAQEERFFCLLLLSHNCAPSRSRHVSNAIWPTSWGVFVYMLTCNSH